MELYWYVLLTKYHQLVKHPQIVSFISYIYFVSRGYLRDGSNDLGFKITTYIYF